VGGDVDGGVVEPALQTLDAASSCWVCDAIATSARSNLGATTSSVEVFLRRFHRTAARVSAPFGQAVDPR